MCVSHTISNYKEFDNDVHWSEENLLIPVTCPFCRISFGLKACVLTNSGADLLGYVCQ